LRLSPRVGLHQAFEIGEPRCDVVRIARTGACCVGEGGGGAFENVDLGRNCGVILAQLGEALVEDRLREGVGGVEALAELGVGGFDVLRGAVALDMEEAQLVAEDRLGLREISGAAGRDAVCAALEQVCGGFGKESSDWLQKSRLQPSRPFAMNVGKGGGRCKKNRTVANRLRLAQRAVSP
jgi:hypothetical protein